MKRVVSVFFSFLFLIVALSVQGATTVPVHENESQGVTQDEPVRAMKEYAGRYFFTANGSEEAVDITVVNDSLLNISAYMGEGYLKRIEKDKFAFTEYTGTVEFLLDESNKIKGFKATIEDAGVYDLEVRKEKEKK